MQSSTEKFSKILPYRLRDIPKMFQFDAKIVQKKDPPTINLNIEGNELCFSNEYQFKCLSETLHCSSFILDADAELRSRSSYLQMDTLVLAMYATSNSKLLKWNSNDYQVCTSDNSRIQKCCKPTLYTHYYYRYDKSELAVECHSPYLLTDILTTAVNIFSIVLALVVPLAIGLISSETENSAGTVERSVHRFDFKLNYLKILSNIFARKSRFKSQASTRNQKHSSYVTS